MDRPYRAQTFEAVYRKIAAAPETLTGADLEYLGTFGSSQLVARAVEARRTALEPVPRPPVHPGLDPLAGSREPLVSRPHVETTETPADFLKRLDIAPIAPAATYDTAAASQALHVYAADPTTLTVADIAMIALVDADLGVRARAKSLGYTRASTADDDAFDATPMLTGAFLHWLTDSFGPILATYRYKAQVQTERIAVLEQQLQQLRDRVLELEAQAAAVSR